MVYFRAQTDMQSNSTATVSKSQGEREEEDQMDDNIEQGEDDKCAKEADHLNTEK